VDDYESRWQDQFTEDYCAKEQSDEGTKENARIDWASQKEASIQAWK